MKDRLDIINEIYWRRHRCDSLAFSRLWNRRSPWNKHSTSLFFHITILILFYIDLGISVIFDFIFSSKINKRTPTSVRLKAKSMAVAEDFRRLWWPKLEAIPTAIGKIRFFLVFSQNGSWNDSFVWLSFFMPPVLRLK